MTPKRLPLLVAFALALPALAQAPAEPVRTIDEGVLDQIKLYVESPPAATVVIIRPFDASKADLGTGGEGGKEPRVQAAKAIQASGPTLLAESFSAELAKLGPYTTVRPDDGSAVPEGALVVEGRFTQIDPGSKAKRYWVGFGSGKSGTTVEGSVRDAAGNLLATFTQKRIAVMGVFGGDYVAKMTSDCRSIGEDIARFLNTWATGKPLKKK